MAADNFLPCFLYQKETFSAWLSLKFNFFFCKNGQYVQLIFTGNAAIINKINILNGEHTLFTIRISIKPIPLFGTDGTAVPVHVPIGIQMQVCTAGAGAGVFGGGNCGIGIIAGNGLYIGNGGGNNGNLLRETKIKSGK